MRLFIPSILLVILFGCGTESEKEVTEAIEVSNFNLESDYLNFKEKMEDGDTLRVFADLSICTSWHVEENLFVKHNGKVYLQSENEGEFVDSLEMSLPQVEYAKCISDTLAFEAFFKYLGEERKFGDEEHHGQITISYKGDTIRYRSHDLIDAMRTVDYYIQIKRCLFPEVELYQPVEVPQITEEENTTYNTSYTPCPRKPAARHFIKSMPVPRHSA